MSTVEQANSDDVAVTAPAPGDTRPAPGDTRPPPGAGPRRGLARNLLALARPGQWFKNLLVVPLALLSASTWSAGMAVRAGWAVLVFTVAAALVYVVNDIADRDRDRLHATKRYRPVASGRVPVPVAWLYAVFLGALLCAVVGLQPAARSWPVLVYLALNAVYSARLKHVPLLDIFIVSAGFLLRMAQGYAAVDVPFSDWLLVCVFAFCLLLSLGKRRYEILVAGTVQRPALRGYTVTFADHLIVLNAGLTATAFLLYLRTESPLGGYRPAAMLASVPFALFAMFRYLQTLHVRQSGGDPVRAIVRDPVLVAGCAAWAVVLGGFFVAAHHPALVFPFLR